MSGALPITARMLIEACAAHQHGEPGCEAFPERILAAHRNVEPCIGEQCIGGDHRRDPDEPELLADIGQHHVGVRFGQVEDLLDALAEPHAEPATGAHADLRLTIW